MLKIFAVLIAALGLGGLIYYIVKKLSNVAKEALKTSDEKLQQAAEGAGQAMESIYNSLFGADPNRALIQVSSNLDWAAIDKSVADSQAARAIKEAEAANAAYAAAKAREAMGRGAHTEGNAVIPEAKETTAEEDALAYAEWVKANKR